MGSVVTLLHLDPSLGHMPEYVFFSVVVIIGYLGLFLLKAKIARQEVPKFAHFKSQSCGFASLIHQLCPTLFQPYHPTFWCFNNGHMQTIIGSKLRKRLPLPYHRELLDLADGGTVALDWCYSSPSNEHRHSSKNAESQSLPNKPIVIILHGVTGGSSESYVTQIVHAITTRCEWNTVVFNQRGCGNSKLTSPKMYCAAASWDLHEVIESLKKRFPTTPLLAIGFSMGANVLVKYLGEYGQQVPLVGAISVANPMDCAASGHQLMRGFSAKVYGKSILRRIWRYMERHREMIIQSKDVDFTLKDKCTTVWDFDHHLTSKAFGYGTAENYYRVASSCRVISNVKIPLLCLNAEDDPIAPAEVISTLSELPSNVVIVTTTTGGHIGWLEGLWPTGANWADRACVEFLQMIMKYNPSAMG